MTACPAALAGCGITVPDGLSCDDTHACPSGQSCVNFVCGSSVDAATDAGALDAGRTDAGRMDAGAMDAGPPGVDAGMLDAGPPPDAGPPACGNGRVEAEPTLCFGTTPSLTLGLANGNAVRVADMNGDGHADLVTRNMTTLAVILGRGDGTFQTPWTMATDPSPGYFVVADADADGSLDVVMTHSTNGVRVLWGDGAGHVAMGPTGVVNPQVAGVAVGNLNGDARPDIVAGTVLDNTNNVAVLYGAAGRTFATATLFSSNGSQALIPAVLDANGDGRTDFVITNPNRLSDATLALFLGQASGGFAAATTTSTGCIHGTTLVMGDLNHDGRLDAVVTSQTNNAVCILLGNATGFAAGVGTTVTQTSPFGEPDIWAIGDLDGDAHADLVVGVNQNDVVQIMRGSGDGTVQPSFTIPTPDQPSSGAIADFDEDGANDYVIATAGATMSLAVYLAMP
ncbi:MAG: FG-GAP repeat domain-containing protein [Sandaracinaceae bacterium]